MKSKDYTSRTYHDIRDFRTIYGFVLFLEKFSPIFVVGSQTEHTVDGNQQNSALIVRVNTNEIYTRVQISKLM